MVKFAAVAALALSGCVSRGPALEAGSSYDGSRRGDLGPDTVVYTKAQADVVFVARGEVAGLVESALEQYQLGDVYFTVEPDGSIVARDRRRGGEAVATGLGTARGRKE